MAAVVARNKLVPVPHQCRLRFLQGRIDEHTIPSLHHHHRCAVRHSSRRAWTVSRKLQNTAALQAQGAHIPGPGVLADPGRVGLESSHSWRGRSRRGAAKTSQRIGTSSWPAVDCCVQHPAWPTPGERSPVRRRRRSTLKEWGSQDSWRLPRPGNRGRGWCELWRNVATTAFGNARWWWPWRQRSRCLGPYGPAVGVNAWSR